MSFTGQLLILFNKKHANQRNDLDLRAGTLFEDCNRLYLQIKQERKDYSISLHRLTFWVHDLDIPSHHLPNDIAWYE